MISNLEFISSPIIYDNKMKILNKYYIMLVLLVQCYLYGQVNTDSIANDVREKYPYLKVESVKDGIIKVTYPDGMQRLENILPYLNRKIPEGIGYTVIDVPNTDTIPFFWKYKFWQQLHLSNYEHRSIKTGDVNKNGLPELYGFQYIDDLIYPVTIFEKDYSNNFNIVHVYPETNLEANNIYDIDKDGNLEVALTSNMSNNFKERFFKKPAADSLATNLSFTGNYLSSIEHFLGDFDGDSLTDLAFTLSPSNLIRIFEYDPNDTDFVNVYDLSLQVVNYDFPVGYAIGDFDDDKKTELVSGDVRGSILIVENTGDNSYDTTWSGAVTTHNAYNQTQTNDIDRNGKKEFWVMGYTDYNGTEITIFEATGDNQYEPVGMIDLLGVGTMTVGNMEPIDIDKDGVDEIVVSVEQYVIILKFIGSQNDQRYAVYYIKKISEGYHFQNAMVYDLGIGKGKQLLISYFNWDGPRTDRTDIYVFSKDSISAVENENQKSSSFNFTNYPNQFNNSTRIQFSINESSQIIIKIYNILGEEVKQLLESYYLPGSYSTSWDGDDEQGKYLPSGLYFITLNSGGGISTIKTILLK